MRSSIRDLLFRTGGAGADLEATIEWLSELAVINSEHVFASWSRWGWRSDRRELARGVRIAVIGGGTAGLLAAIVFRRAFRCQVTLIESSQIPIIGVGEATVPRVVRFLHELAGLDIHAMHETVGATWKQGIRFFWGSPAPYYFHAPFDWGVNSIGVLGSLRSTGTINAMTIQSLLMEQSKAPVFRVGQSYRALIHRLPFAYHLDNRRLVRYLHETATNEGVQFVDTTIVDAEVSADRDKVLRTISSDGRRFEAELFVDCSGFRSLLLEKQLGSRFVPYDSSLFTDRAVIFERPNGGLPDPYTSAITMNSGWTWVIPLGQEDHLGYVYSSAFCGDDEAVQEIQSMFRITPKAPVIRFRSGRHEDAWRGNVLGIGNSYGFVEPLESTGLLMICEALQAFTALYEPGSDLTATRRLYNNRMGRLWDGLRWFLSVHFRFNRRLDTPFWLAARNNVDISGIQDAVELFIERSPLRLRGRVMTEALRSNSEILFYGLQGLDCILAGQRIRSQAVPSLESETSWRSRAQRASNALRHALGHSEALQAVRTNPTLLDDVLGNPHSWIHGA